MIQRLRPALTPDEQTAFYPEPHTHTNWEDHVLRVNVTAGVAKWYKARTAADLSAGDAAIINSLDLKEKYIGDFAPGYDLTGPLEYTITQIPHVDLFIYSETIEHVNNPWQSLRQIRDKATHMVLTTPWAAWDDPNPEHLWAWDEDGIAAMLDDAGWEPDSRMILTFAKPEFIYSFQIWGCS